jgi:hypothetical protein
MERELSTPTDDGVHDARLSEAANAALTWEVQAVIDGDAVHGGPTGEVWHPRSDRSRRHWRLTTAVFDARILVVPALLAVAITGVIALIGDTYVMIAVAWVALVLGVLFVAEMIARMTREVEHLSPETAALLEGEGIGDPDRLFGDLLAQRRDVAAAAAAV